MARHHHNVAAVLVSLSVNAAPFVNFRELQRLTMLEEIIRTARMEMEDSVRTKLEGGLRSKRTKSTKKGGR